MTNSVEGFEQLERKLLKLGNAKQVKGVARNAIRAGQRVVVTAMKTKIPGRYKEARKAIGSTLKRVKFGESAGHVAAKVGAAVGKKKQKGPTKRSRRGVGLGARSIHWGILGTKERETKRGNRRFAGPHSTGQMPAILAGVVQAGLAASGSEAVAKMKQNMAAGIQKLAK